MAGLNFLIKFMPAQAGHTEGTALEGYIYLKGSPRCVPFGRLKFNKPT